MKEYKSKAGGRYIFNEDLENLQELALSMANLFADCNQNFVISGCEVTKSGNVVTVGSGFAFIDGKIRKVTGVSGTYYSNGVHIIAVEVDGPDIVYADGTTGKQYVDYRAEAIVGSRPTGVAISINDYAEGKQFPNLRTVFFKKYAVMKGSDGVSELIKMLVSGASLNGDSNGKKSDFYSIFSSPDPSVQLSENNADQLTGIALNNAPIYTLDDANLGLLLLAYRMAFQTIYVQNKAYIKELFVDDAHIPHTVRVLASAKMLAGDGTTQISSLTVYVTNFELVISGSCTSDDFGDYGVNSVKSLYLPNSIKNIANSRSPIKDTLTNNEDSDVVLYSNESVKGIFYLKNVDSQGDLHWTSSSPAGVKIRKTGVVVFTPSNSGSVFSQPKFCVHFNMLFDGDYSE